MNELQKLNEARQRVWAEMRALSDSIAAEGRDFSAEEESAWQKANADLEAIDARLAVVIDLEKRNADVEAAMARFGAPEAPAAPAPTVEDELRALGRGEVRTVVVPAERRDLTRAPPPPAATPCRRPSSARCGST